ncbi:purine and uridine phosphorylase [Aspergillus ellipticus CBS 707.79]|uniref:Purine and uridine phosphorylase n=1 Tax=Aspergillus ellipticus CBS 707.79 TaxID=1448320 RepID=A0A319D4A2_9EURO|nr:purine and uridine phosphorylase [Aspergillus ellipticus CBS 707.79]
MRPQTRAEFKIAIICALPHEADAVEALFDETYDTLGRFFGKQPGDINAYANGRIGDHDVVLCHLPGKGKGSAASAASSLVMSYTEVDLALGVGVYGGVPSPSEDIEIALGDVIISDTVIELDFGGQYPDGFRRTTDVKDTLGRPNREIRALLEGLKTRTARKELQGMIATNLLALHAEDETMWQYPGAEHDVLFEISYRHRHQKGKRHRPCICYRRKSSNDPVCDGAPNSDCVTLKCSGKPVYRTRPNAKQTSPHIHIGTIASADTVMKSGKHRDNLALTDKIIGFEMEGAGVRDNVPCLIIKGVCDYADSHKNKIWQSYAAATEACVAKAFLKFWRPASKES